MGESMLGALPVGWEETSLGDVCQRGGGKIQTGPFGSQLHASDYVADGIPTVMPTNIGDNRIVEEGIARIRESDAQRLARHRLQIGDIVYSRRGDVERRALVRQHEVGWLCGTGSLLVRVGEHFADATYVSLWLGHPQVRAWITQHAVGATMPNLNTEILSRVPVVLPPVSEQRAIAKVLGVLDDKIESNSRLIKTVMALSCSVFESSRDHTLATTSTTFDAFAEVYGGATPSTGVDAYWGQPHAWVTPSDVTALGSTYLFDTARHITSEGLTSASTELHPPGTIFMTSRATIGAFAVNQVPCAPNQGFIVVRPRREAHRWFIFHEMQRRVDEMIDRSSGSTFRELSRGSFRAMSLDVPIDESTFDRLHDELDPLHARAALAARESRQLAALRDALSPELLSGRVRVREAEMLIEDSA